MTSIGESTIGSAAEQTDNARTILMEDGRGLGRSPVYLKRLRSVEWSAGVDEATTRTSVGIGSNWRQRVHWPESCSHCMRDSSDGADRTLPLGVPTLRLSYSTVRQATWSV